VFYFALLTAKIVDLIIRTFHLGSGSTWPGEIALQIDSNFIFHSMENTAVKIILVAGTNGKTTTSLLIVEGLKKAGKTVIHNPEGANLLNGITSSLIRASSLRGKIGAQFAVFELDENTLPQIVTYIKKPYAILLLNLFRDQLDRYGEVNTISTQWMKALSGLQKDTKYIINGDDPRLAFIGKKLHSVYYFGANNQDKQKKTIPHDVDSIYCPQCGNKLTYSAMSYSHLGDYLCTQCSFSSPKKSTQLPSSLTQFSGVYNRYNLLAAVSLLQIVLHFSFADTEKLLNEVKPAFGRQERFFALNKEWIVILSKNPSGFNQSIESLKEILKEGKTTICIVLNDRIPDGTDVSWIWDVEFEHIYRHSTSVIVSGDRTYDMAICMKTQFIEEKGERVELHAEENLEKALIYCVKKQITKLPIVVLATYTGMLEVRKILIGKKLL